MISTGRRTHDGHITLSSYPGRMIVIAGRGGRERTPTRMLTLEQAAELRDALTELIAIVETEPDVFATNDAPAIERRKNIPD